MEDPAHAVEGNVPRDAQLALDQLPHLDRYYRWILEKSMKFREVYTIFRKSPPSPPWPRGPRPPAQTPPETMPLASDPGTECFYPHRNPVEDEVVLPALVNLVEPVLDIVVGHHQTLHLGSRLLAPCSLLGRLLAAGQGAPGHSRAEAEAASSSVERIKPVCFL